MLDELYNSKVLGRYEEAQNNCQEAISLANELDHRTAKIFAESLLSLRCLLRGDLAETEQGLERAMAMYADTNYIVLLTLITAVYSILGHFAPRRSGQPAIWPAESGQLKRRSFRHRSGQLGPGCE